MRTPTASDMLYFYPHHAHIEPSLRGDNNRRSNWSPGYYGRYVPLLTPTSDSERDCNEIVPDADEIQETLTSDRMDDDGAPSR